MNRPLLEAGELVLWQGRPAPRCYTFRLWKQGVAGALLFLASSFWLMLALELIRDGHPFWLALIPLPLLAGSFVFGPLQILLARRRWPKIFYLLTSQRLISTTGWAFPLSAIRGVKIRRQGEKLASLKVDCEDSGAEILFCIEYPEKLLALLETECPQLKV